MAKRQSSHGPELQKKVSSSFDLEKKYDAIINSLLK